MCEEASARWDLGMDRCHAEFPLGYVLLVVRFSLVFFPVVGQQSPGLCSSFCDSDGVLLFLGLYSLTAQTDGQPKRSCCESLKSGVYHCCCSQRTRS